MGTNKINQKSFYLIFNSKFYYFLMFGKVFYKKNLIPIHKRVNFINQQRLDKIEI